MHGDGWLGVAGPLDREPLRAGLCEAAAVGESVSPGSGHGCWAGILPGMVVHRLFGIGLILHSAVGLANGPVAYRLRQAVEELDAIIRDVRTGRLRPRRPRHLQS